MALDTLFSQAYGAKNYALYAIWLLAGSICIAACSVVIALLLLQAEPVLLALQMDPALSASAAGYVTYLVPGMFPNVGFLVLQKYLQSQEILAPAVYVSVAANVFNVVANYALVYRLELGLVGARVCERGSASRQLVLV